jgi:hypothetical protein
MQPLGSACANDTALSQIATILVWPPNFVSNHPLEKARVRPTSIAVLGQISFLGQRKGATSR